MYKTGGNKKKGAKFGTFLYFLYIKKSPIISNQDPIIIRISDKMRNRSAENRTKVIPIT